MTDKLTAKQEGFTLSVAGGLSLAQAYRDNYNVGEKTLPETVWRKAVEVMQNGKVTARLAELQQAAQERTMVTIESITAEYDENRMFAAKLDQPAAMNSSTTGKAKLHGLLVEKSEVDLKATVVNFDGKDVDL